MTGATERRGDELVVLVGAARSGSTLLRLLLDAHPEIGCPAEAGIPGLMQQLLRVWWTIDPHPETAGTPEDLSEHVKGAITDAVRAPMDHYCAREGKHIYCDKSLDSVHHLELVHRLLPETRYILLFRHVMDAVASGLEASPWGFQAYGYLPFVQAAPDNFVAALVSYWLNHVDRALQWEETHPDLCCRVRYEDLVTDPQLAISRIFGFLGVEADLSVLQRAFGKVREETGPGDYKVTHTSGVHSGSVGHGKRVPVTMIPPGLLEATNAKLETLGHEPLSRSWNAEPTTRPDDQHNGGVWSDRLTDLMRGFEFPPPSGERNEFGSFAVVAEDHQDLRWVIDPAAGEVYQGDGEVESVLTGTVEALVSMIGGETNLGVLLRSGRIRHLTAREDVPPHEVVQTMNSVLDLLRPPDRPRDVEDGNNHR